ncbi:MAG TPA: hypothetical protein ENO10_00585 [Salinimicrobium catena]|uniref:Uncharacterized protein n=1 Tax=Salinimicrobium catena TaxID=390640 RepID=A0A7C2M796_9FLAO|nr:hypothetical protein [Salinimicrobium catena]
MPEGLSFYDKENINRTEIRIKWWEDPSKMTYRSFSVEPLELLPEDPVNLSDLKSPNFYRDDDKQVFFGHYWLRGEPSLYKDNICCLDYSIAKEGKLVAYRHNGESVLDKRNLVYV